LRTAHVAALGADRFCLTSVSSMQTNLIDRFHPLGDLIVVRPASTIHDGLIEVPEIVEGKHSHQPGDPEDSFIGEVVAVGPGDRLLHGKCTACGAENTLLLCRAGVSSHESWKGASFGACECGNTEWSLT